MTHAPEPEGHEPRVPLFDRLERRWVRFWGRVSVFLGTILTVAALTGIIWFGNLYLDARANDLSLCSTTLSPVKIDCGSVPDSWVPYVVVGAILLVGLFGYLLMVVGLKAVRGQRQANGVHHDA